MPRDRSGVAVKAAARRMTDDDRNRFSPIEIGYSFFVVTSRLTGESRASE